MPPAIGSDEEKRQDEVLSKVDTLLRRHRTGILDASTDAPSDDEIPLLTEVIDEAEVQTEPKVRAGVEATTAADTADVEKISAAGSEAKAPPVETSPDAGLASPPMVLNDELIERLHPEIERAVAEALAAQLPRAIQDQVMPEVMVQLGDGLNRLRDAMRNTVRGVVQETIEQEVKRALKALIKEREQR